MAIQPVTHVSVMTPTPIETRRIRKELLEDGADPFWIAAEALQTIDRLKRQLAELQRGYDHTNA